MPTQVVPLEGIDKAGVIMDSPAVNLPPGAWTDARNVRFDDGAIRKMAGQEVAFDDDFRHALGGNYQHIAYWENPNVRCYVVIDRFHDGETIYFDGNNVAVRADGDEDAAFLLTIDGQGRTITEWKGTFTASNNWTSLQYNGGYSFIINNAIDPPHHITVQLGGTSRISGIGPFEPLPNWESYQSGTYVPDYLTVAAEILIPYGNLLVAAALTERSFPQMPFIDSIAPDTTSTATVVFENSHGLSVDDEFVVHGDGSYTFTWQNTAGTNPLTDPPEDASHTVVSPYNATYTVTAVNSTTSVTCSTDNHFLADITTDLDAVPDGTDPAAGFDFVPPYGVSPLVTSYNTVRDGLPPPTEVVRDLNGVVRTSSVAPPGAIPQNWDPFAIGAGTADEINLADAGKITSVRELRGNLFVYTSDSITQLRVSGQGLTAVPITKEYGALAHGGVFSWQGTHIVVGSDDIYTFSGNPGDIKSIVDGRVRDYFFSQLDPTKFRNMQIVRNQEHDELWVCYPTHTVDDETLDEAMVWDYTGNTWVFRDLPNIVSLTKGPIPGLGTQSRRFDLTTQAGGTVGVTWELTVVNANGQSSVFGTEQGTIIANDALVEAVTLALDGQAGFSAREEGDTVLFNDLRVGKNPWQVELRVGGILVPIDTVENTNTNSERPWPIGVLNESHNFIVMASLDTIYAAELGHMTGQAYFERYNLHFSPTKDTEALTALYLNTEGDITFDITLTPIETAGKGRDIGDENELTYLFNFTNDYKIDTRITSRLVKMRFAEPTDDANVPWEIASIDLEIGKRGTR